jgi:hypothetical protein
MFEKIALPKDSNRLPGIFITAESIRNTNNSTNIKKIEFGPGRDCLDQEKLFKEEKLETKNVVTLFLYSPNLYDYTVLLLIKNKDLQEGYF